MASKEKLILGPARREPFRTLSIRLSTFQRIDTVAKVTGRSKGDIVQALLDFALERAEITAERQ